MDPNKPKPNDQPLYGPASSQTPQPQHATRQSQNQTMPSAQQSQHQGQPNSPQPFQEPKQSSLKAVIIATGALLAILLAALTLWFTVLSDNSTEPTTNPPSINNANDTANTDGIASNQSTLALGENGSITLPEGYFVATSRSLAFSRLFRNVTQSESYTVDNANSGVSVLATVDTLVIDINGSDDAYNAMSSSLVPNLILGGPTSGFKDVKNWEFDVSSSSSVNGVASEGLVHSGPTYSTSSSTVPSGYLYLAAIQLNDSEYFVFSVESPVESDVESIVNEMLPTLRI